MEFFKYEVYIQSNKNIIFDQSGYPEDILGAVGPNYQYGLLYLNSNYDGYDTYSCAAANPLFF